MKWPDEIVEASRQAQIKHDGQFSDFALDAIEPFVAELVEALEEIHAESYNDVLNTHQRVESMRRAARDALAKWGAE